MHVSFENPSEGTTMNNLSFGDEQFAAVDREKLAAYIQRRLEIQSLPPAEARAASLALATEMQEDLTDAEMAALASMLITTKVTIEAAYWLRDWAINEAMKAPAAQTGREYLVATLTALIVLGESDEPDGESTD